MEKVSTQVVAKDNANFLKVTLAEKDFYLPFKLIGGRQVAFLDISGQVALIEACADLLAERIVASGVKFDTIMNPVAKSNALAHAVAVRLLAKGYDLSKTVVARKAKEGEHHTVDATYRSVTTPVDQTMYLTDDDVAAIKGKNILLMDDVFGMGGTTLGLKALCEKAGANITGHAVIAIEEGTNSPEGLIWLYELPVL